MTAGNIKFLILHSGKGETEIKNFFYEVHDFYVKVRHTSFVILYRLYYNSIGLLMFMILHFLPMKFLLDSHKASNESLLPL